MNNNEQLVVPYGYEWSAIIKECAKHGVHLHIQSGAIVVTHVGPRTYMKGSDVTERVGWYKLDGARRPVVVSMHMTLLGTVVGRVLMAAHYKGTDGRLRPCFDVKWEVR